MAMFVNVAIIVKRAGSSVRFASTVKFKKK